MPGSTPSSSSGSGLHLKPPRFRSDVTIRAYFAQIDDFCDATGVTDDGDKISLFKCGLDGANYERFCLNKTLPATFSALKKEICDLFDPEDEIVFKDKFHSAVQLPYESARLFIDRLIILARKSYATMSSADRNILIRDQLVRGLRERRLKDEILLNCGLTFDDLVKHLERYDTVFRQHPDRQPVNSISEDKLSALTANMDALTKQVAELQQAVLNARTAPNYFSKPVQCWNCGRDGHTSRRCRAARVSCPSCGGAHQQQFCRRFTNDSAAQASTPATDVAQVRNFSDLSFGEEDVSHISSVCASDAKMTHVQSRVNEMSESLVDSAVDSFPFTGIFAKLRGEVVKVMIDSGAKSSLISEDVWISLGSPHVDPVASVFHSANGSIMDAVGAVSLPLSVGNTTFVHRFIVMKDLNVGCLLGENFLVSHRCVVDFDHSLFHIDHHAVPLFVQTANNISVVRAVSDHSLQPWAESVMLVKCDGILQESPGWLVSAEPHINHKVGSKILVASCLVSPKDKVLPIKVVNLTESPVTIKSNEPIAKVETVQFAKIDSGDRQDLSWDVDELCKDTALSETQKQKFLNLLQEFRSTFANTRDELGATSILSHTIDTGKTQPIRSGLRRIPHSQRQELETELQWLLDHDVIQPSSSPWASPIVMVRKRCGSLRLCIDYRRLNAVTVKDSFPLPRIEDVLDSLAGCQYFSTLDLATGYYQVPMAESDVQKTAFLTPNGLFEFKRMPMGVCNGPACFQRLMSLVLQGLVGDQCMVYLDDIICFSKDFDDHISSLRSIFTRLADAGLTLKATKCVFFRKEVSFLGHIVSKQGVATDTKKVDSIKNCPAPASKTELRAFLGLSGYYRRFIRGYSEVAAPLYKLSGKEKFSWNPEAQIAFDSLKCRLTEAPILALPDTRSEAGQFTLDIDASGVSIGAVLSQQIEGKERVISYGSKSLDKSQRNYCTTRRELYALVYFAKHFRAYLLGRHFAVRTDHRSLQWLASLKNPEGQLARWLVDLQEFDFSVSHRPGKQHTNADALSRLPTHPEQASCPSCAQERTSSRDQQPSHKEIPEKFRVNAISIDESLLRSQLHDHDIQIVRVGIANDRALSWDEKNDLSTFGLAVYKSAAKLSMEGELLGIRLAGVWKPILPSANTIPFLREIHDGVGGGHFGIKKTVEKVKTRCWWPGWMDDVKSYIAGCPTCAIVNDPCPNARAALQPFNVSRPFQTVAMDMIGPITRTSKGNIFILTIIDLFTKWGHAIALPGQDADTTIDAVITDWIARYGVPETVHTDQGPNFVSARFSAFVHDFGMRHTRSSALHAQGNGQVERFNRTLKGLLRKHVSEENEWDAHLPQVVMAYNSSVQESTGFSPYQMLYGCNMPLPIDNRFGLWPEDNACAVQPGARYLQLKESFRKIHAKARLNLTAARRRQKTVYDRKVNETIFQPGDAVWLFHPATRKNRKLHKPWRGPYKVLEVLKPSNYRIRFWGRDSGKTLVVHHNRLKRCNDVPRALKLKETRVPDPMILRFERRNRRSVDHQEMGRNCLFSQISSGESCDELLDEESDDDDAVLFSSVGPVVSDGSSSFSNHDSEQNLSESSFSIDDSEDSSTEPMTASSPLLLNSRNNGQCSRGSTGVPTHKPMNSCRYPLRSRYRLETACSEGGDV